MIIAETSGGQGLAQVQTELFNRLKKDREDNANILEKTSMKGVKQSVTDKYSEQAHFIYELLQNADDARASRVRFVLDNDGLYFAHNGSIHFSISDPDSEKEEIDKINGVLGHINSITSIAHSTKSEAEIGKFGIGFKSVFQYTNTPHIYDKPFKFKIERFIVPVLLKDDHPERKQDETLFYFPFNLESKTKGKAYEEIGTRLKGLNNPSLFLRHIEKITWNMSDNESCGTYSKKEVLEKNYRKVTFITEVDGHTSNSEYIIFDKDISNQGSNYKLNIAYSIENSKISSAQKYPAYCFFATHATTELRFIINAPFLLTDNRENIKQENEWNKNLIAEASVFISESLSQIKDMGLLNVDFLMVLPNNNDELEHFYRPIHDKIIKVMQTSPLVPTYGKGYAPATELLQGPKDIKEVITDIELPFFTGKENIKWAVGVIQNSRADQFIKSLEIGEWRWSELVEVVKERFNKYSHRFNSNIEWLRKQTDEWMQRLYALLDSAISNYENENRNASLFVTNWVLIRTSSGEHVAGISVYFPSNENEVSLECLTRVKAEILNSDNKSRVERVRRFLEKTGVKEAGEKEEVEIILNKYYGEETESPNKRLHLLHIERFISYWTKCRDSGVFYGFYIFKNESIDNFYIPENLYIDQPYLDTGLSALYNDDSEGQTKSALWHGYLDLSHQEFINFAVSLGVCKKVAIRESSTYNHKESKLLRQDSLAKLMHTGTDKDYKIDGLERYLQKKNFRISLLIWKTISEPSAFCFKALFQPNQQYPLREKPSTLVYQLKSTAWIPDRHGVFHKPGDISMEMLRTDFSYDDSNGWPIAIGFGENVKKQEESYRKREEMAIQLGIPIDLIDKLANVTDEKKEAVLRQLSETLESILSSTRKEPLPESPAIDHARRAEKSAAQVANAPDKEYEDRTRSIRITANTNDPRSKEYLRNHYKNEDGNVVCQLCEGKMPFKLEDGNDYFEAVQFIRSITKEIPANHIALCPNCAAEFKNVCDTNDDDKRLLLLNLDVLLPKERLAIMLDMPVNEHLHFTQRHLIDLKPALQIHSSNYKNPPEDNLPSKPHKQEFVDNNSIVKTISPKPIQTNQTINDKPLLIKPKNSPEWNKIWCPKCKDFINKNNIETHKNKCRKRKRK